LHGRSQSGFHAQEASGDQARITRAAEGNRLLQQRPGQRRALRSVKQREVMLEKNNKTAVLGLPPRGINSSQPISAVKFLCVQKGGKINVKELDVDDLPRHSACAVAAIAGCGGRAGLASSSLDRFVREAGVARHPMGRTQHPRTGVRAMRHSN
jgi:hypothetical protein